MASDKSLAAEIEAVLRKHVVGADAKNAHRHELLTALSEAAAEIATIQSRAVEDGARTVVLPAGWVAVPRHPTTAMKQAAARAVGGSWDIGHEAYAQAIAAAPALASPNTTEGRTDRA